MPAVVPSGHCWLAGLGYRWINRVDPTSPHFVPSPVFFFPIGSSWGKKLPVSYWIWCEDWCLTFFFFLLFFFFSGSPSSLFISGTCGIHGIYSETARVNTTSYKVHNDRDVSQFLSWPNIRQLCSVTLSSSTWCPFCLWKRLELGILQYPRPKEVGGPIGPNIKNIIGGIMIEPSGSVSRIAPTVSAFPFRLCVGSNVSFCPYAWRILYILYGVPLYRLHGAHPTPLSLGSLSSAWQWQIWYELDYWPRLEEAPRVLPVTSIFFSNRSPTYSVSPPNRDNSGPAQIPITKHGKKKKKKKPNQIGMLNLEFRAHLRRWHDPRVINNFHISNNPESPIWWSIFIATTEYT